MSALTISEARSNLYRLIDKAAYTHEPISIKGKRSSAVLIGQEDWEDIQETLYLCSIPGMEESIIKGGNTPLDQCIDEEDVTW